MLYIGVYVPSKILHGNLIPSLMGLEGRALRRWFGLKDGTVRNRITVLLKKNPGSSFARPPCKLY